MKIYNKLFKFFAWFGLSQLKLGLLFIIPIPLVLIGVAIASAYFGHFGYWVEKAYMAFWIGLGLCYYPVFGIGFLVSKITECKDGIIYTIFVLLFAYPLLKLAMWGVRAIVKAVQFLWIFIGTKLY